MNESLLREAPMARKKKTTRPRRAVWQAQPDDAIRLAALRWFALEVERLSIEIYATDKRRYVPVERLLRDTLKRMGTIRASAKVDDPGVCPDGYVLCKDGLCAPMCDWLTPPDDL
jgi:hypothetical protein